MAFTNSPNMSLPIPGVGTEAGPNYALDVNASLTLIDQHDHSSGRGVQVTPSGLNINANLSFQTNAATALGYAAFSAQSTSLSTIQTLYVAPGTESPPAQDLWYTDSNGTAIQLTAGGVVNATIGSLPGESYAAGTFFWKQGSGSTTPANFDIGSITLRPNSPATANGVILGPPSAIASQYNISLPLLPASARVLSIDNTGAMATGVAGTVQTVDILDQNVTQAKLALRATGSTVAAGGVASASLVNSGIPTVLAPLGASVTITTTGRPVALLLTNSAGNLGVINGNVISATASPSMDAQLYITNTTTSTNVTISTYHFGETVASTSSSTSTTDPTWNNATANYTHTTNTSTNTTTTTRISLLSVSWPVSLSSIDFVPAGTYTYTLQGIAASGAWAINNAQLIAYEI